MSGFTEVFQLINDGIHLIKYFNLLFKPLLYSLMETSHINNVLGTIHTESVF